MVEAEDAVLIPSYMTYEEAACLPVSIKECILSNCQAENSSGRPCDRLVLNLRASAKADAGSGGPLPWNWWSFPRSSTSKRLA